MTDIPPPDSPYDDNLDPDKLDDDYDAADLLGEDRRSPDQDKREGPPHPINWNLLGSHDLEIEWLELNRWVHWLRHDYGLAANVIPPFWHHHPELVWELSALHLHWLCAYDPEQDGSAPLGWHRDFVEARQRLSDWVAASGTRRDHDRATRQTSWPGEAPAPPVEDIYIADRETEFVAFVFDLVQERRAGEDAFFASLDPNTGEIT